MAHVPVIRRSMRPDEWTRVRMGWLRARIFETVREIEGWTVREGVQTGEAEYRMDDDAPRPLRRGDLYFTPDGTAFLSVCAQLPPGCGDGSGLRLRLRTAAEMIVKINGEFVGGLDPNRDTLPLPPTPDGRYRIEIEGYNRSKPDDDRSEEAMRLKGCRQVFQGAQFVRVNEDARTLYYDAAVFWDILQGGQWDEDVCAEISPKLYRALNMVDWESGEGMRAADEYIRKELYGSDLFRGSGRVALVAHSHLDIAYYWRRVHSVQKNARTCLIQMELMERYPELTFTITQAYLFETLERNYPELYRRVAEKVRTGAFELVGGMYVESDCNLLSAESLARQFFYGQRYFLSRFGKTCNNCFLPDVFGNSAVLPQILKQSGIDYFVSNKMSTWNDTNRFPHNHFIWRGLDGSQVYACVPPTHFITACTPTEIMANWAAFQDKGTGGQSLCMFGYGDGGSGVTEDMMEYERRLNDIGCMPRTELTGADAFLRKNLNENTPLSVWDGELYLEMHRGTFTTKSELKRRNRALEILLRDAEMACALKYLAGAEYPAGELEALWKALLVNQFHDILPGSHIRPVFEDAMRDYDDIQRRALALLPEEKGVYFNSLNFKRTGPHFIPDPEADDSRLGVKGRWTDISLPPLSCGPLGGAEDAPVTASACRKESEEWTLRTDAVSLRLLPDGSISSLMDEEGREYAAGDFNRLRLFEDIPGNYDAWDILPTYRDKPLPLTVESPLRLVREDGQTALFSCTLATKKSRWLRRVRVWKDRLLIEVENEVDWREDHVLAKAEFVCNVRTPYALCDTGAGFICRETNRNTTWQQARYEVCHHKWCDLSETGGGVALINQGKYGVGIWDNVMSLSLLRAPCRPDLTADRGKHEFCYLIMPHAGTATEAGVNRAALMYNHPLREISLPALHLPEAPSLFLQAMKRAEEGGGLILRLCEQDGRRGKVRFPGPVERMDILETKVLEVSEEIAYRPFEIITLRLSRTLCAELMDIAKGS